MNATPDQLNTLMLAALEQARIGAEKGEVPVGAVVASEGNIICRAHNLTESLNDATAHAECLAIREASRILKNWRLADCTLCVTLEPCAMCLGAIRLARIPLLVFGANDEVMGAAGSTFDLTADDGMPRVISGIMRDECAALLRGFFEARRKGEY